MFPAYRATTVARRMKPDDRKRQAMNEHLTEPNPALAALVKATIPGMAHWAGTGPRGKTCGECEFLVSISVGVGRSTRCEKYQQMMNGKVGSKKIPEVTPSCKYFEPIKKKKPI